MQIRPVLHPSNHTRERERLPLRTQAKESGDPTTVGDYLTKANKVPDCTASFAGVTPVWKPVFRSLQAGGLQHHEISQAYTFQIEAEEQRRRSSSLHSICAPHFCCNRILWLRSLCNAAHRGLGKDLLLCLSTYKRHDL